MLRSFLALKKQKLIVNVVALTLLMVVKQEQLAPAARSKQVRIIKTNFVELILTR